MNPGHKYKNKDKKQSAISLLFFMSIRFPPLHSSSFSHLTNTKRATAAATHAATPVAAATAAPFASTHAAARESARVTSADCGCGGSGSDNPATTLLGARDTDDADVPAAAPDGCSCSGCAEEEAACRGLLLRRRSRR